LIRAEAFPSLLCDARPMLSRRSVALALAAACGPRLATASDPAAPALVTGAATWLACTARRDLAPPR